MCERSNVNLSFAVAYHHILSSVPAGRLNPRDDPPCNSPFQINVLASMPCVVSIQIFARPGNNSTLPELLNNHSEEHGLNGHKHRFSACRKCRQPLSLLEKRVIVDRVPFILCVGINISPEAQIQKALLKFISLRNFLSDKLGHGVRNMYRRRSQRVCASRRSPGVSFGCNQVYRSPSH